MLRSLRGSSSCLAGFIPQPVSVQLLSPTHFLLQGPGLFPHGMVSLKGAANNHSTAGFLRAGAGGSAVGKAVGGIGPGG